jgi:cell division protein FtsN
MRPNKTVLYYRSDRNWRGSKEFTVRTWPTEFNQRSSLVYLLIDNSYSMTARNIEAIRESAGVFIDSLTFVGGGIESQLVYRSPAGIKMRPVAMRREETPAAMPNRSPDPVWPTAIPPESVAGSPDGSARFTPSTDMMPLDTVTGMMSPVPVTPPPVTLTPTAPPSYPQPDAAITFDYSSTTDSFISPPMPVSPRGTIWVQTSSHENLQIAEEMSALLRKYQFAPVITEAKVNSKTFYRVRLGPYTTSDDARRVIDFVKQPPLGFFDSFIPSSESSAAWSSSPLPVQPDVKITFADPSAHRFAAPPALPSPRGTIWVQTSSHENLQIAEEKASLLRKHRFSPVISEARVKGKTFYRVRLGPYINKDDARRVIDAVKQPPLGFYDSFIP